MNNFNYPKLAPFKWFVLQNFPFIEYDFDALTNWQLFCKLGKEMNKIIEKVNLSGEQVENLTNAFNDLESYVNNYFENLDIQDEINTKLDEMAESGELADIIAQYLESQAIIGFNNVSSLANATNLADGSFARTYGKLTYNDGKGAFYKIRTRINADVPDDDNIVVLVNTENLVGEKIPDFEINSLKTRVDLIENRNDLIDNRRFLIVGDSYAEGYTPDGNVTSWATYVKNLLGLANEDCVIVYQGGYGLVANGTNTFYNLINAQSNDDTITDVIVAGGYNDTGVNISQITQAVGNLKTLIKTKYSNVKNIYLGFIGGSSTPNKKYALYKTCNDYIKSANENNISYLNNVEYSLKDYFNCFSSDGFHPNQTGQYSIALNIVNCLKCGTSDVHLSFTNIHFDKHQNFTGEGGSNSIGCTLINGTTFISLQGMFNLFSGGFSYTCNGSNTIELGTITSGYITGSGYNTCEIPVSLVIQNGSSYYDTQGIMLIENGKLYIRILKANDAHNNYMTFNDIKQIQIAPFSACFDTLFC